MQFVQLRPFAPAPDTQSSPPDGAIPPLSFVNILPKDAPACSPMRLVRPCPGVSGYTYGYSNAPDGAAGSEVIKTKQIPPKSFQLSPSDNKSNANDKVKLNVPSNAKKTKMTEPQATIHLLKYGLSYQSLGKLEANQLIAVKNALKKIGDPMKNKKQSFFDKETKTRVKYRIVYPEDLKVTGTSQIVTKVEDRTKKTEKNITNQSSISHVIEVSRSESSGSVPALNDKSDVIKPTDGVNVSQNALEITKSTSTDSPIAEEVPVTTTRSGRKIKIPKEKVSETIPKKRKRAMKKSACICGPTPALVKHVSLFDCFLNILCKKNTEDKCDSFIEQLDDLIIKIRNLLPCMIDVKNEGKICTVNENVGKFLNLKPGKYKINVDEALDCVVEGYCKHVPKPTNTVFGASIDMNKPSQLWLHKHKEEIATLASEDSDCARTYSVDKWPSIKQRLKKYYPVSLLRNFNKTPKPEIKCENQKTITSTNETANVDILQNAPMMDSESTETNVQGSWIIKGTANTNNNKNKESNSMLFSRLSMKWQPMNTELNVFPSHAAQIPNVFPTSTVPSQTIPPNKHHYHSSHFDIRSSPIKSSNATFNKIQIKGEDLPLFMKLTEQDSMEGVPINELANKKVNGAICNSDIEIDINGMFNDINSRNMMDHCVKQETNSTESPDNFNNSDPINVNGQDHSLAHKDCVMPSNASSSNFCNISQSTVRQNDRLLSSGGALLQNVALNNFSVNENTMEGSRMALQLLESLGNDCLSFTDTELRGASLDLPLDLFPFHPND